MKSLHGPTMAQSSGGSAAGLVTAILSDPLDDLFPQSYRNRTNLPKGLNLKNLNPKQS